MTDKAPKEAERIRNELADIERVVAHAQRDWKKFVNSGDDAYLKAVAYDLHGFYGGLERIFQTVADTIDDYIPSGQNWHKDLLAQMANEIKNIRPALISEESASLLDEYMRFRHRIRNIYSFNLLPDRIEVLVQRLPDVFEKIRSDLADFAQFLEEVSGKRR